MLFLRTKKHQHECTARESENWVYLILEVIHCLDGDAARFKPKTLLLNYTAPQIGARSEGSALELAWEAHTMRKKKTQRSTV